MSYIVTARKWRPQLFRDVISQQHVTGTLKSAIKSGRVAHAYLFSGPRGVGKTTVARIFAKALNCVNGPAEEPCDVCENCKSIQSGASMDVHEIDGASHSSVEDARDLISKVGYHASHCRYKMYIVDEVHMLSDKAFDALLKTIEEPPPDVIFVFATTEPHKIPVTILSRCQRFDFHRLSVHEIGGKLRKVAEVESIMIDDAAITLIARRATGAMRDAESILEQLRTSRGAEITVQDVNEVLGIADRGLFFSIIDRCRDRDTHGVLELFNSYYDEGGDLKEFVEGLLTHLRDLLYARFEDGLDQVALSEDMLTRLKSQSEWFLQGDIIRMIQYVTEVETSLAYTAVMPVLRIETALVRMAVMESTVQLKALFDAIGGQPESVPPVETPQQAPSRAGASGVRVMTDGGTWTEASYAEYTEDANYSGNDGDEEVTGETCINIPPDIDSIRLSWRTIADRVGAVKPGIGPSLEAGWPESYANGKLTLRFSAEHEFHLKKVESNIHALEEIIGALVGEHVKIACYVQHTGEKKKATEVDDLIKREPIIGDILERFNGEINRQWRE